MSDGPYLISKEFCPTTSVIASAFFQAYNAVTSKKENFLITLTVNLVNIYRIHQALYGKNVIHGLEMVKFHRIFGKLNDIGSLQRGDQDNDLLFLTLDSGKIVAFEYEIPLNDIIQYPLFNLEEEGMGLGVDSALKVKLNGRRVAPGPADEPLIRINNNHKIVASLLYGENIFFAEVSSGFLKLKPNGGGKESIPFSVQKMLKHIHADLHFVGPILDISFVSGYSRPTVAILHQLYYLPTGHAKKVLNTCAITVFTVDLDHQSMSLLWSKSNLPHDSLYLIESSSKAMEGWVICISQNAIVALNEHCIHGFALNSFASISLHKDMVVHSWNDSKVGLELDASRWTTYGDDSLRETSLIGFLRDGTVVLVRILFTLFDVTDSLRFDCQIIGEISPSSCISLHSKLKLLFSGSRFGQSSLFEILFRKLESINSGQSLEHARKWILPRQSNEIAQTKGNSGDILNRQEGKKVRNQVVYSLEEEDDNVLEDFAVAEQVESEERHFYGCSAVESDPSFQPPRDHDWVISLVLQDKLSNFGPILSGCFTKAEDLFSQGRRLEWERRSGQPPIAKTNQPAAAYITDRDCRDALIVSSGYNRDACLHRVLQGIAFSKIGNRNFLGATYLFTLPLLQSSSLVVVSYEGKSRVLCCNQDSLQSPITVQSLPEINFQEFGEDSGLVVTSGTIFLGRITSLSLEGDILVQVIPLGVRLVQIAHPFGQGNQALQDMLLLEDIEIGGLGGMAGEIILTADVCPEYLVLLTNFHRMFILKLNQEEKTLELVVVKQSNSTNHYPLNGNEDERLSSIQSTIVSVSLYFGHLSFFIDDSKGKENGQSTDHLTPVQREELFLYGHLLEEMDEEGNSPAHKSYQSSTSSTVAIDMPEVDELDSSPPQAYLIVYEEKGLLSFVRLSDCSCVMSSSQFSKQEAEIKVQIETAPQQSNGRYIMDCRLFDLNYRVHQSVEFPSLKKLCLMLLFSTGELVVYHAFIASNQIHSWFRVVRRTIHNKRFFPNRSSRAGDSSSDAVLHTKNMVPDSQESPETFLETEEYRNNLSLTFHKFQNFHLQGQDAILISGNDPLIYVLEKGCSLLTPVGFPETPYVNYGRFLVLPLQSCDSNRHSSIIATLWFEFEDIDVFKNPGNIKQRAQRQSTFGLYRLLPDLHFSPYEAISFQTLETSQTIHRVCELARLTDHTTEQALLEKKTFLLYSSKDVYHEFIPDLPAVLQENMEDVLYERYFPHLESFQNPDSSIAPHPLLKHKEFRVSLVQAGRVVDSFLIADNDLVVDVTPLYLTVEKPANPSNGNANSTKIYERRVFILVSVLNKDTRGEDSQGNGKLLLLGIDYAMFEEDSDHADDMEESHESESKSMNEPESTRDSSASRAKSAQKRFLGSIQPKLKQLWTGPGPASVVYQMPSFSSNLHNNPNNVANSAWSTSVDSMNATQMFSNYVIATVGATLYIYRLNSSTMELDQVTFYFSQFYITSVNAVKNYIIITDMFHSTSLLFFREEDLSLHLISKDFEDRVLLKSEVLLDGSKIGFITSDDRGNIQCFQQNRRKLESLSGTKLLCLSEFHLGSEISCMINHDLLLPELQMKKLTASSAMPHFAGAQPPPPPPRTRRGSTFPLQIFGTRLTKLSNFPIFNPVTQLNLPYHRKTSLVLGSVDGSLGTLLPLEERMYKRLLLLQQVLSVFFHATFSMNAVEFRYHIRSFRIKYPSFLTYLSNNAINSSNKRRILDGSILSFFLNLDCLVQEEIAQLIGVTSYILRENLHEVDYLLRYF